MSGARRRGRPAPERLSLLLIMLPWLMERGTATVAETAERFGLSEDEVVRDLELVAMCGLPPFVDELIDIFVDDGQIGVGVPRLFKRPLRLNAVEAWELLAAGRAAMELPGADRSGALGRGLAKLADAVGDPDDHEVSVELDRPRWIDQLAEAATDLAELRIAYRSGGNDAVTQRTVVPRQVFHDRGEWYLTADDGLSGEVRTFRVDRIEEVEPTGAIGQPSERPLPQPGQWFVDSELPRAILRVAPGGRWFVERYPVDTVSEPDPDGWVTVTIPLASPEWLARTVLQLGPDARVVEPQSVRVDAQARAQRLIELYSGS